ncbi:MAG: PhoD-like phosphatase N-terminal domain-containing protein, partial [Bacteroidetes bacterium]|nr:PhoD-like phosphatase N-terminal domain-containing protein [Bacteroidota bacterium]
MKNHLLKILPLLFVISCNPVSNTAKIYLGQGIMSGEITSNSAILQSRLTLTDSLINNDLPGIEGFAKFEIANDADFTNSTYTEFIGAIAANDFIIKKKISGLKTNSKYYYRVW